MYQYTWREIVNIQYIRDWRVHKVVDCHGILQFVGVLSVVSECIERNSADPLRGYAVYETCIGLWCVCDGGNMP
jgi:hypothetical protein